MTKFNDTEEWKTRAAFERTSGKVKRINDVEPMRVKCPTCRAACGRKCVGPTGVVLRRAHRSRLRKARARVKAVNAARAKIAGAQRQRWRSVTVRFVCPLCGGAHAREACTEGGQ